MPESSTNNFNPACDQGEDPHKAVEQPLVKGSPRKVRQFLPVTIQKSKLKSCSQTLQMLKGRQIPYSFREATFPWQPGSSHLQQRCITLVSCAPWNAKAEQPLCHQPCLCDLRDPFQPELLLPYFRAANLLCLYTCKICTGTLLRHKTSPWLCRMRCITAAWGSHNTICSTSFTTHIKFFSAHRTQN